MGLFWGNNAEARDTGTCWVYLTVVASCVTRLGGSLEFLIFHFSLIFPAPIGNNS